MAETTGIAWTDHTWSPWIGCAEVSPGCQLCYARELDKRHRYGGATHWGVGVPRYLTKQWQQPVAWNKKAETAGVRRTIFPSLCDPFDNEVPEKWRVDLFDLIGSTPALTWLLLTKRIGNVAKCGGYTYKGSCPPNVWLGASVVNQEEADRDIPKLLATPAAKRFVSYEPALGPVDFRWFLAPNVWQEGRPVAGADYGHGTKLDWLICGGESAQGGAKARPFDVEWARSTVAQCKAVGVPVFVKQLGSNCLDVPPGKPAPFERPGTKWRMLLKDRAGADPAEWPEDLRIQCFPVEFTLKGCRRA